MCEGVGVRKMRKGGEFRGNFKGFLVGADVLPVAATPWESRDLPLTRRRRRERPHLKSFILAHEWWTELSPSRPVEALVRSCLTENEKSCWWNANNPPRVQTPSSEGQKEEPSASRESNHTFSRRPLGSEVGAKPVNVSASFQIFILHVCNW